MITTASNGAFTVQQAGRLYRDAGLSVVPIRGDGSKQAKIAWKPFQRNLPNDSDLQRFNDGGIAVVGGKVSGNLEIVDFDHKPKYAEFVQVCVDHGYAPLLESLPLVESPRGFHLYYRCEEAIEGNQELATCRVPPDTPKAFQRNGAWWKCLIETRGEGGYALTYPSPAECHPEKQPYQLLRGSLINIPVLDVQQRQLILNLARSFHELAPDRDIVDEPKARSRTQRSVDGLRPGDDYNQRGDYEALLQQHRWHSAGAIGDKTLWKRPNKKDVGISATSNYANSGLFHVFSTNAFPFEARRTYAPFAVYAWLEHNGDFQAAARALGKQGYGQSLIDNDSLTKSSIQPSRENLIFDASPRPLVMRLRPIPPLPPAIIPAPFRDWLQDIADRISCPIEYPAVAAIIAVAAVVGRKCGIKPKQFDDWLSVPNLWGGIVGPPGVQKTPATDEAMKALKYLVAQALKKHEREMLVYEAEVEATKNSESGIKLPKPVCKRYIVNDPTVEALGERLRENLNGLLVYRDELMGFLRSMERQGREGDRTFYLETWNGSGQNYVFDRIGRGTVVIPALCTSIFGTIQPGPLGEYTRKADGGIGADGFIQRFQLLVYPDPIPWRHVDRQPNLEAQICAHEVFERLDQLDAQSLGAFVDGDDSIPFLRFDADAQPFFNQWRSELEINKLRAAGNSPAIEAHLSKYRSLMPSLALLFHLIECVSSQGECTGGPVSLTAAKYAAAWCDFLELHMRRIYGGAVEEEHMKNAIALKKHLESLGVESLRIPAIVQKGWKGLDTTEAVNSALELLEQHNWIKVVEVATGGRPSRIVHLHPQLSEGI